MNKCFKCDTKKQDEKLPKTLQIEQKTINFVCMNPKIIQKQLKSHYINIHTKVVKKIRYTLNDIHIDTGQQFNKKKSDR